MSEKPSMSTKAAIQTIYGKEPAHGEISRMLDVVARAVPDVSYRTVRSLWHGEIENEDHLAATEIRRHAEIIEARREAQRLADQYATLATYLRNTDEDFFCSQVDRLERLARRIGGLDP